MEYKDLTQKDFDEISKLQAGTVVDEVHYKKMNEDGSWYLSKTKFYEDEFSFTLDEDSIIPIFKKINNK